MKGKRTRWTQEQKEEFKRWHDELLDKLAYPDELKKELARTCTRWLEKA